MTHSTSTSHSYPEVSGYAITESSSSVSDSLDLAVVLQASQTLSREIELSKLLSTLLHIVIQAAGAGKGLLMLLEDGELTIQATAELTAAHQIEAQVQSSPSPIQVSEVPISLINSVKRSLQSAVIIDAIAHPQFATDVYIQTRQPKSLLCSPILHQGKLLGMVYLENNLVTGAFTRDRVELLNLLCAQAAISLENARLFDELKATQTTIQNSQQNLRAIFDNAHDAVFIHALDGTILDVNDRMLQMYGVSRAEATSFSIAADYSGSENPFDQLPAWWEQAIAGEMLAFEWQARRPHDASLFTVEVALRKILLGEQAVILANVRDISDHKAVEAALKAFQEKLTFLIQQTPIGIIEWNTEFKVISWNPTAEKIFGYSAEEMLNQHAIEIVPELERAHVAEVMQALIAQNGGHYSLNQNIRKDQTLITCEWINTPLRNTRGEAIGIFSMVQDISDRIAAETTILQKSQALEAALAEVQNAQLQMVQNEKMVSLGNLVAGVAHEINNPIGFLNGSINNAKDYVQDLLGHLALYQQYHPDAATPVQDSAEEIDLKFLGEDLPKLLDSMQGATERIRGISTSLRTFSRADVDYKISANIHDGLDSTLLILKYRLKANEQRPEIEVIKQYGELPMIDCFPGQLNQVFMNILANAIDVFDEAARHTTFTELKTNPQTVMIQTTLMRQNTVEIRIRDNGPGMTDEVKTRVFDHLFTTKEVGKGTGLGLAIARQIVVENHHGRLEVQSQVGQGTEFYIRLPSHAQ